MKPADWALRASESRCTRTRAHAPSTLKSTRAARLWKATGHFFFLSAMACVCVVRASCVAVFRAWNHGIRLCGENDAMRLSVCFCTLGYVCARGAWVSSVDQDNVSRCGRVSITQFQCFLSHVPQNVGDWFLISRS